MQFFKAVILFCIEYKNGNAATHSKKQQKNIAFKIDRTERRSS